MTRATWPTRVTQATRITRVTSCFSEPDPNAELRLSRVAKSVLYGAVEVEDQVRDLRAPNVLAVRQVEDLENGFDRERGIIEPERSRDADVPGKELVVLPQRVALDDAAVSLNAILWRVAD